MTKSFPFEVDTQTDVPLWVQLRKRLVHLIDTSYYKPGDQLPTVRGLASELAINYNTVNKTYLSMINDGYITSMRGRGVFVRELNSEQDDESTQEALLLIDDCIGACLELGLSSEEIRLLMNRRLKTSGREERAKEAKSEAESEAARLLRIVQGSGALRQIQGNSESSGA